MNNENLVEKEGLTLSDLLYIARKHLIVIITAIVLLTSLGFGFGLFRNASSPEYKASGSLMVSVEQKDSSVAGVYDQYRMSQYITDTFIVFATKDVVLEAVVSKMEGKYELTIKNLKKALSVELSGESLIIDCSYATDDVDKSIEVLNCFMDTVVETANKRDGDKPAYKFLNDNIVVLDVATRRNIVQESNTFKFTILGFALGAVVAFLYCLIRETTNKKFKDVEEVERLLGLPVLAGIPNYVIPEEKKDK